MHLIPSIVKAPQGRQTENLWEHNYGRQGNFQLSVEPSMINSDPNLSHPSKGRAAYYFHYSLM